MHHVLLHFENNKRYVFLLSTWWYNPICQCCICVIYTCITYMISSITNNFLANNSNESQSVKLQSDLLSYRGQFYKHQNSTSGDSIPIYVPLRDASCFVNDRLVVFVILHFANRMHYCAWFLINHYMLHHINDYMSDARAIISVCL